MQFWIFAGCAAAGNQPRNYILEAISKDGFCFKVKAAVNIRPQEYIEYFEDLM